MHVFAKKQQGQFFSQRNECLPQTSDFLIPISVLHNFVEFRYFKDVRSNILNLDYQSFTPSGCKDKGIRRVELVLKALFLCTE